MARYLSCGCWLFAALACASCSPKGPQAEQIEAEIRALTDGKESPFADAWLGCKATDRILKGDKVGAQALLAKMDRRNSDFWALSLAELDGQVLPFPQDRTPTEKAANRRTYFLSYLKYKKWSEAFSLIANVQRGGNASSHVVRMAMELGEELLKAGEQLQAARALQIANDSFQPGDDMHYDCMEYLHLGNLWLQAQNRTTAEGLLSKARAAAEEYERQPPKFDYPYNRAAMWGGIASLSQKIGDQQGANEAVAKAKIAAESHRRPDSPDDLHLTDQLRAYQTLARFHREMGRSDEARQALSNAISVAMKKKPFANQGENFLFTQESELDQMVGDEIKRGDIAQAKGLLARADLAPLLHLKLCGRLATYHAAQKQKDVALEFMQQEDQLLRKCQLTPEEKGILLAQMAKRYAELGQNQQAKKCMQEATELATPGLPLLQSTIATIQIDMGELDEAHSGIQSITDADSKVFLLLHLLSAIQKPRIEAYKARNAAGS